MKSLYEQLDEYVESEEAGKTVWEAWCNGMQIQGREVSEERLHWETLPARDKKLDAYIAQYVIYDFINNAEESVK